MHMPSTNNAASTTYDHYTNAINHHSKQGDQWVNGANSEMYTPGQADTTYSSEHSLLFNRLAGSVYVDINPSLYNGYFDVNVEDPVLGWKFVQRVQNNAPGRTTRQTLCVLSYEQFADYTFVKIILRKGAFSLNGVGFKDDGYGLSQPIGMMQGDCVFSGSSTSLSDQRLKTNVSTIDSGLLLDFCNSLSPNMYSRIDLTPQPRLGLIAQDVEAALETHALPKSPFINKLYQALEDDGEIEELLGLDYSRLSVCLLGAVKELTTRITQLESQLQ